MGIIADIFPIFFILVFCLVFGTILFTLITGIAQWNKNNRSPRLTVPVTVVAKRTQVGHHHYHGSDNMAHHTTAYTTYYATFQVASGDRMELTVPGNEFGLLAEGDRGQLTFQGTRYLSFTRE